MKRILIAAATVVSLLGASAVVAGGLPLTHASAPIAAAKIVALPHVATAAGLATSLGARAAQLPALPGLNSTEPAAGNYTWLDYDLHTYPGLLKSSVNYHISDMNYRITYSTQLLTGCGSAEGFCNPVSYPTQFVLGAVSVLPGVLGDLGNGALGLIKGPAPLPLPHMPGGL
ncbi:MAG TPA: hypothetical protein VHE37_16560 [Nevskiaceae bacterium]|nr:hypothetical protein [Nevskiaceae bacterium]